MPSTQSIRTYVRVFKGLSNVEVGVGPTVVEGVGNMATGLPRVVTNFMYTLPLSVFPGYVGIFS